MARLASILRDRESVMDVERYWPLFGLRLATDRLELRLPTDDDLAGLLDAALEGIHPEDEMPFSFPWTRRPRPEFEYGFLSYHWQKRADWKPEAWTLELGVFLDGEPVGFQGISATDFAVTRSVLTGSWLTQQVQGQGIGKEMRAAVLALAFEHLGAVEARSAAVEWNEPSRRVSTALGYVEDGTEVRAVDGGRTVEIRYVIGRERWEQHRRHEVEVHGFEPCRDLFGVHA